MAQHYRKGEIIKVVPTPPALKKSYPCADWITECTFVVLREPAVSGTLDVFDVEPLTGGDYSIYGFNILEE
jgi:hypothetical protein